MPDTPGFAKHITPPPLGVDEYHLGELRPSLLLAMPRLVLGVIFALLVSHYLPALLRAGPAVLDEKVLLWGWVGAWAVGLVPGIWQLVVLMKTSFEVTSRLIFYNYGVFNAHRDQLEIARIRDLAARRPFFQRLVGLGYVHLDTVDRSHPTLVIPGQRNVNELKRTLHELNVKERARLGYREFEGTHAL